MVPANEHLTMQLARQVYKINTAENGLIFFKDGSPAYITRRFDIKPGGGKFCKEDFATFAGKTKDTTGPDFKYEYSYQEMGTLMQTFAPARRVEVEKFFALVVFNFLFSNGDAHLKNFALLESANGDHILSPAYDLVNMRIHEDDSDFALSKGLFADKLQSAAFAKSHHPGQEDFLELARRIRVNETRAKKILELFLTRQENVEALTSRSFLNEETKRAYLLGYRTKRNMLAR
jgi:serine/threonine-protein kinase HipA